MIFEAPSDSCINDLITAIREVKEDNNSHMLFQVKVDCSESCKVFKAFDQTSTRFIGSAFVPRDK